ncbi:MAG: beta-N-acetylhexosaminidase [Bdellovibrionales bacterium]
MNLNNAKAVVFSVAGAVLSDAERSLFAQAQPLGFILFARNCENPQQLKKLTHDLREAVGWHCPILIDQEGGRVQRLKPPVWRKYPPMRDFGLRAENGDIDSALGDLRFTILQLAEELIEAGVNVNCAPVLDVLFDGAHDVIGDRAFSSDPQIVGRLGLSVCRHLLAAGVVPVVKHLPGHGRAKADSHKDLPHLSATLNDLDCKDFEPFRIVLNSGIGDQIWGMAAHIVYDAIDADLPSSASSIVIDDIIRGRIGFDGFLLSDDLDMQALGGLGDIPARALAVLNAGCDAALYCAGDLCVMEKLARIVLPLTPKARKRLQNSYKPFMDIV